jgi:putative SOS response-associated peptidase YedK
MCGRYTLSRNELADIARELEAVADEEAIAEHRPRWNIAPTDSSVVVLDPAGQGRRLVRARWGIGERRQINWRSERKLLPRRCVVPADGFYEWHEKQPLWFHDPEGKLLLMAGLYEETRHGLAFTIVTGPPGPDILATHDRMPVLLLEAAVDAWLTGELPVPPPPLAGTLVSHPVSKRVGSVKQDDPGLVEPAAPEGQLALGLGRLS